jgi:tRNA dimethylallyltransferase
MMDHDAQPFAPIDPALRPIVVLGPTAGGKSELAVRLAEHYRGQVISADSMQVYRHMDVGTAKPSLAQRRRVVHHLVDVAEPTQRFTLSDWLAQAEAIITKLQNQHIRPIIVGGTNLYIKGLLEGLFEGPDHDPAVRSRLDAMSLTALRDRLEAVDPAAAQRIHRNDRRKMVRAIEVYEMTGQPITSRQTQWHPGSFEKGDGTRGRSEGSAAGNSGGGGGYRHDPVLVGLEWAAEAINPRINLRVKAMFYPDKVEPELLAELNITRSLVEEVADLEARRMLGFQARQALGYRQVLDAMEGRLTMEQAYEKTRILTRRFAKTQRTWLRRYQGVKWLAGHERNAQDVAEEAMDFVSRCK